MRNGKPTHVKLSKIKGCDDYAWVRKIHVVSAKVVSIMRISDSLDEHMTFMTRMKPLILRSFMKLSQISIKLVHRMLQRTKLAKNAVL